VKFAAIGPIGVHYPARVETNADLQREFPEWDMEVISEKTGIERRYIAAPDECSSDLGVAAAERLFADYQIDRRSIDYLLFCTQTPDYPLPTTACLIQHRLGLRTDIGAIDFNQGCSGFVYGLSLAEGLTRAGAARRILLITAETYSKFIHPSDRSLRTIFGDGAAATLIEGVDQPSLTGFVFGTDGSGANTLLVTKGGFRSAAQAHRPRGRKRWPSDLYMDGHSLMTFTVDAVPVVVQNILERAKLKKSQIDYFLLHQATAKMLQELRKALDVAPEKLPICLSDVGNTVSSTLPILIDRMRREKRLSAATTNLMIGFGVGWSWAGCIWRDLLSPLPVA
jgi:3-oxoacyl-[acyl-carrier-protein] synthase-3